MVEAKLTLIIVAKFEEILRLNKELQRFTQLHGIGPDQVFKLELILDELINNVIKHGEPKVPPRSIFITMSKDNECIEVEFSDDATLFNPLNQPEPALDSPLEERPVGGLGVHLVRKLSDEVKYSVHNGRNLIQFSLALDETA